MADITQLEDDLSNAQNDLSVALINKSNAQDAVASAQDVLTESQNAKDEADAIQQNAQSNFNDKLSARGLAETALQDAQQLDPPDPQAVDDAQIALEAAQADEAAAQEQLNQANDGVNAASQAIDDAQNQIDSAQAELAAAENEIDNAQAAIDVLTTNLDDALAAEAEANAAADAEAAAAAENDAETARLNARSINASEGIAAQEFVNTPQPAELSGNLVPPGALLAGLAGIGLAYAFGKGNNFLKQLGAGTNIKDYKHASKIFVDGNYRLSPKYGFLFHVSFDLTNTRMDPTKQLEMGMMVKTVNLPKFTVDTKTFNAYNRPNVVQTKLKYDPVTITFHDDSSDVVRDFWYDYMSLYYRDSDYDLPTYQASHKYTPRLKQDWGYQVSRYGRSGQPERMLNAIRIYSLHQRRFTEYILVNPTITSFQHGEHQNGGSETMQHTMTVTYETVLYNYGYVQPGVNTNFAVLHYDQEPSPLTAQGGGTQSILGPGGLLSAVDSIEHSLGQGNILGAGLTAWKAFNNMKGASLGQMAGAELKQIGKNILTGNNPLSKIQIPSLGGLVGGGGLSGGLGSNLLGAGAALGVASLFGGQRGGALSPTGATAVSGVMATAATKVVSYGSSLFGSGSGGTTGTRAVQSNGEYLGGTSASYTGVPASPYQTFDDGSSMTTDPETGYQYVTDTSGLITVSDASGNVIRQVDSTGRTLLDTNPETGELYEPVAGYVPSYDEAQTYDGEWTNMNTYAGNDEPTDQGNSSDYTELL